LLISDWCWKQLDEIPGRERGGTDKGEREYGEELAGRQTRGALDRIASVAASLTASDMEV
jgi:hypothetical protein